MKLRAWIDHQGMSQAEAADLLGVSEATMSRWISGKDRPNWPNLAKITLVSKGLVSAADFMESDPDPLVRLAARVVA